MSNVLYKILNENNEKVSSNLIYVSKARYEMDWHSTLHSHPFTELFYVVSGSGNFLIEGETYHVMQDDLVIVNANVQHTESSKDSNPLEYIVLGIEGLSLLLEPEHKDDQISEYYSIHNYRKSREEILHFLDLLLHEVENRSDFYDTICQNLLNILILNVIRRSKSNLVISTQKNATKECTYIRNYIDIHYASPITLDLLANETYLDKFYLIHVFKKQYDISPINYLIEKRIEESINLLENTNYSVSNISSIVGFNSQSYYSQIFKRKTGLTPAEHRKKHRKK
ncbi:AraC family transcriptional regulator [Proteiniclasticum sp.]|uniref:AraC family transcriptional regulator n=1 Tax=Proteiniclasticum sp. TaxID=2053595 RepID=UPI0028A2641C|nr:AraC family transcriptional regulator [Proteiniclasticum sp.]